jgi:hypothetical protein
MTELTIILKHTYCRTFAILTARTVKSGLTCEPLVWHPANQGGQLKQVDVKKKKKKKKMLYTRRTIIRKNL